MQKRTPLILWAGIACLLAIIFVMLGVMIWQRVEVMRLKSEVVTLRGELNARTENFARSRNEVVPEAAPDAFAKVPETAIPGSYRFFELGKDRGVVTLNADHTFVNEKGEGFPEYTWNLSPDRLVLQYRRVAAHYTNVESPGVYVGLRTDNKAVRLEKVEK
jgi:hypothetical protein